MHDIKAIFIDFDGTLYSHVTNQIPKSTIKALNKLHDKGIMSFLSTGRAPAEAGLFDMSKVKLEGKIFNNGQIIKNDKDEIIFSKPIEGRLKERIIELFNSHTLPVYLSTTDSVFINYVDKAAERVQMAVSSRLPYIKKYEGEDIFMASVYFDNPNTYNVIKDLEDIASITSFFQGAYDMVPKGLSKQTGVEAVCNLYNITQQQTMAFGDGENDLEMLEHCQIGVAMGNSIDSIKEIADYITTDIDNDGIANALKHYKLI